MARQKETQPVNELLSVQEGKDLQTRALMTFVNRGEAVRHKSVLKTFYKIKVS